MEDAYLESTHTNIGNHQGRDAREMGGRREWGWQGGGVCREGLGGRRGGSVSGVLLVFIYSESVQWNWLAKEK